MGVSGIDPNLVFQRITDYHVRKSIPMHFMAAIQRILICTFERYSLLKEIFWRGGDTLRTVIVGEGNFRNLDFFQAFQFIMTPQFMIFEKKNLF